MADEREPPPMDEENDRDDGDLFESALEPKENKNSKTKDEANEEEDLFQDAELSPDSDKPAEKKTDKKASLEDPPKEDPPKEDPMTPDEERDLFAEDAEAPEVEVSKSASAPAAKPTVKASKSEEEIEEEESGDQYSIEITVTSPTKKGDGMGSYMVYQVNTKTTIPAYKKPELSVTRRFSDFLGLHDKLAEKHIAVGRIVPPAPEKSVIGMTKVKMSKDDSGSSDFVEKRRAALERYLNRTAAHPVLRLDPDFREFLENEEDLPKATSTSALSGAGVKRLFSRAADAVGKMTFKMEETDQWFEEKHQQIESMDSQLRKLHTSVEALVHHRKDLAHATANFAKSAAMLGNAEEHTALSRALSQLAEIEEKMEQLHHDQADSDFFVLAELLKDYISMIVSVKEVFDQRIKLYKQWKEAEATLTKKRETKAKLELSRKTEKIPAAEAEIKECLEKVERGQEEFDKVSVTIRKEMDRFDRKRVRDFKSTVINYLETLMNNQQQQIKFWEAFLPEAKAIA